VESRRTGVRRAAESLATTLKREIGSGRIEFGNTKMAGLGIRGLFLRRASGLAMCLWEEVQPDPQGCDNRRGKPGSGHLRASRDQEGGFSAGSAAKKAGGGSTGTPWTGEGRGIDFHLAGACVINGVTLPKKMLRGAPRE